MQKIALEPVDSLSITVLVDNVADALLQDEGPAERVRAPRLPKVAARFLESGTVAEAPLAEHGFSALVTVRKGDSERRLLFDTGVSPLGLVENMRRLQLSARDVECVVLSHGHFDHTTGLDGLARELGARSLPVLIHPEFWSKRRIAIPGRDPQEIPSTSKTALRETGFEVIEERQPSFLLDGSLLVTGEVDRTTDFEKGFPVHQALRDGNWQPDPLILDDQAVITNVRGRGLVALTGCGHAGVVNILRYARKLTGVDQVHAVLGGFHLNGPWFEPTLPDFCRELEAIGPEVIVPAHCTGWKATHRLAATFPESFIQNSVGTRYAFSADAATGAAK
jgi:7,8-dihydropterin-6-yl-methyl-4-(beta-D-ribofuranosyl)aminobenzene 5'-phosphate synthase